MSDVRTFRAATMQDALKLVRQELGADAVILHTRQISHRRILPWKQPKQEVEITAGLEVNIRPAKATRRQRQRSTPVAAGPATAASTTAATISAAAASTQTAEARTSSAGGEKLRRLARSGSSRLAFGPHPSRQAGPSLTPTLPHAGSAPAASLSNYSVSRLALPPASSQTAALTQRTGPHAGETHALAQKLDSIHKMLENLGHTGHVGGSGEIPSELFHLYTELIDAEVEDDLARDLIFRLKQNATPAQLGDGAAAKALMTAMVESEIRCSDPIAPSCGKRKVVALVGPTGVGKTTTIAKLAANFRLRDGVKMGLVTVDTYRVAAVEQLRTYAEIIDLPMKVVTTPLEMRRALDELIGLDLVLIDTAGRSPRDELKIQELKSLLGEADVDEVHLVLSVTASARSLQSTAENFAAANTTAMILTKLDEAAGMGSLVSVSRKIALPISYLTTGQDVPDDIEPANASRISRLVLGQDKLFE